MIDRTNHLPTDNPLAEVVPSRRETESIEEEKRLRREEEERLRREQEQKE